MIWTPQKTRPALFYVRVVSLGPYRWMEHCLRTVKFFSSSVLASVDLEGVLLLSCFRRKFESLRHMRAYRVVHAAVLDRRGAAVGGADE